MEQNKQGFEAPLTIWKEHEFVEFFATSVKTEYNVANSVEFLVDKVSTHNNSLVCKITFKFKHKSART